MRTRIVWGLLVAGMACGAACSSETTTNVTYVVADGGGQSESGAGDGAANLSDAGTPAITDAGAADAGPANAFTTAAPFEAGTASTQAQGHPGHVDPVTARSCMASNCHGGAFGTVQFAFAGTVFGPSGLAGPGIEVRVTDVSGTVIDSVYTDPQGNFWSVAKMPVDATCLAGVRNAKKTALKTTGDIGNDCNASGCHQDGLNPMLP